MSREWWKLTWLVTRREINDRARAKSFWIASVLLLVAVALGAIIPALLQGGKSTATIGIIGGPSATLDEVAQVAGRLTGDTVITVPVRSVAAAKAELLSGRLSAVLVGDSEVLVKKQPLFNTSSPGSSIGGALAVIGGLQKLIVQLPPSALPGIAAHGIALPVHGLTTSPGNLSARFTGLAVAIIMFVVISTYGIRITISVGEEKASRVVEVLLTTLRPVQLLAGKVIGMGLLALGQITAMAATYLVLGYALGSNTVRGASTGVVIAGALWLILGYAFYCTAYAAAGSLISRQSDAYNAALPLQIPLIFAYVMVYTVIYVSTVNPFFHVLGFIPFTAPVTMPVLIAVGAAPAWQVAVSALITLASVVVMVRLAGTIYGRAILRTGGRLKVRQVLGSPA